MIFIAVLLGIVEGLTEFLPVSSTGHLILVNKYVNFTGEFANAFAVIIQLGAILAVLVYFRKMLIPTSYDRPTLKKYFTLWSKVVVGVIPAIILGLLFGDYIDEHLFNAVTVSLALIVGGIILIFVEKKVDYVKVADTEEITYKQSFVVGIVQCLALWPGMSRSASTIIGGLALGFSREVAAQFSFFLALPTLAGAAVMMTLKYGMSALPDESLVNVVKYGFGFTSYEWLLLAIGTAVSFIVALLVIAFFMNYLKTNKLAPFAYYRIVLGVIVLMSVV